MTAKIKDSNYIKVHLPNKGCACVQEFANILKTFMLALAELLKLFDSYQKDKHVCYYL